MTEYTTFERECASKVVRQSADCGRNPFWPGFAWKSAVEAVRAAILALALLSCGDPCPGGKLRCEIVGWYPLWVGKVMTMQPIQSCHCEILPVVEKKNPSSLTGH